MVCKAGSVHFLKGNYISHFYILLVPRCWNFLFTELVLHGGSGGSHLLYRYSDYFFCLLPNLYSFEDLLRAGAAQSTSYITIGGFSVLVL